MVFILDNEEREEFSGQGDYENCISGVWLQVEVEVYWEFENQGKGVGKMGGSGQSVVDTELRLRQSGLTIKLCFDFGYESLQ